MSDQGAVAVEDARERLWAVSQPLACFSQAATNPEAPVSDALSRGVGVVLLAFLFDGLEQGSDVVHQRALRGIHALVEGQVELLLDG
eukprot:14650332-Heterocapsa_arctica.AAC.1